MGIRPWLARNKRVLAAAVLFTVFAPVPLFAFPLALLLAFAPLRSRSEALAAAILGGLSLVWLLRLGTLPDQVVRASVVIAGLVYAVGTRFTAATVTHRALAAVALASVAVGNMLYGLGSSWAELTWWVERAAARLARQQEFGMWMICYGGTSEGTQMPEVMGQTVRFIADYHPAILAVQLMAGMAVATAIYHRVAQQPRGTPLGSFREFRFNENLGWAAIVPLLVILSPVPAAARLAAANVLVVMGVLYAIRGIAVAASGLSRAGRNRSLSVALSVAIALMILPIALAGAILLGVVDSRMDLRRRWVSPQASR